MTASSSFKIAAIMTCHNRRNETLTCIESLFAAQSEGLKVTVYLTDDGSQDGTSEAVRTQFADVRISDGDGSLFWCRGMARSWGVASLSAADAYLWVNDDVVVNRDSLKIMVDLLKEKRDLVGRDVVVVGSLLDPATHKTSYGVSRLASWWHPTRSTMIEVNGTPAEADSFHGNLVLIPTKVFDAVGGMDTHYSHGMGDTDYAFRVKRAGFQIWTPGCPSGYCPSNPAVGRGIRQRASRKYAPPGDWWYFVRAHCPPWLWVPVFASPYVGAILESLGLRRSQRATAH